MSLTRDQILVEARKLSPTDRDFLIEDLRHYDDQELSEAQLSELRRRVEAVRSGKSELIPADQAIRDVIARLRRR